MSGLFKYCQVIVFILNCLCINGLAHAQPIEENVVAYQKESESFLKGNNLHFLNNKEITKLFNDLETKYPNLVKSYSIGKTLENRNLNVISLTARSSETSTSSAVMPSVLPEKKNILKPLVKMVANIYGDEVLGRQIIIFLAQYLIENYNKVPEIQKLLNTTEIHLLPSCNPDGFANATSSIKKVKEGNCESLQNFAGRTNAAGVDLNRDFPDRLESQQTIQAKAHARQPETAAMIEWILSKPFVLSANFHGGAVVASYPYDNSLAHRECCEDSLTPDDRVFKLMAHTYSDNHPIMRKGNSCNDTFTGGITNGANWYELNGGMQDFNYAFSNCFELTIELSCCKYPTASTLPTEWYRNKRSLINLLKLAHIGVKGIVKDANGYPIHDASIVVSGLEDKPIRTTKRGEYWRLLTPGIYTVQAIAFGYQPSQPQQIHVTNANDEALRLDFTLLPIETNFDGNFRKLNATDANSDLKGDHDKYGFLTPTKFEHHNFTEMEKFIRNIADSYPTITHLYSIGKSVQNRDLWVMEITTEPGQHIPGKPEFKYVANMHGNEVVGKEMLLLLTKYLCERYMVDPRVTKLVNNTRMHFLYSMNPDGYEISKPNDTNHMHGRANANDVDLNRNFPDQYGTDKFNMVTEPEVKAVMNWTLSIPFVLSANLHGGSLVANYPFDDNENDFMDPIARLRVATKIQRKANPTEDNELFRHLASIYANAHPTMHTGVVCPLFRHEVFHDGITNGAQWYSVTGGMQDWNYIKAGVLELTIEMGCTKFPIGSELPQYWLDNKEPLLRFIEQIHYGVHGFVRSSIGSPVPGAMITLDDGKHPTYSATYGDYWRLALPGRHNITIVADGFTPQKQEIEISKDGNHEMRLDIALMRDDPQHWASAYDYRIIENVVHTRYHTNFELMETLAEMENRNGKIATFGYAENEFGAYFKSLKLTYDIGEPDETKFKILILSSFFDTAGPLSREIIMNFARHIIEGYKLKEPQIINLLQKSVLYFLPVTENFKKVFQIYNQNNSICDPVIGDELADRILSPEADKPKDLLLKYFDSERFDLMLTFSAGNSDISYPKSNKIFEKFAHCLENTEFTFSPLKCSTTSTRSLHSDLTERLTNLLLNYYNIPTFTLGLSCCRMPLQTEIASIWRKNLEKMKNFLALIETGVVGQVQNGQGQPLREAFIRFMEHPQVYNVTKNSAQFQIILPEGDYNLEIGAPNYETNVKRIHIEQGHVLKLGVIQLNAYTLVTGKSEITPLGKQSDDGFLISSSSETKTINGYILDILNHPIRNAKVSIVEPKTHSTLRNFTDSMGAYTLKNVPIGDVTFKVEAPRHEGLTKVLHIANGKEITKGAVFYLKKDEHVMGMPRFLFIAVTSVLIIGAVVLCIICVQFALAHHNRADKPYYNFSLLPQKGKDLFDDDLGDDGETELFRSPIKKGMSIKPYYDDDNVEHILNSDDDEDDNDHDFVDDSGDEIVMLEKRKN